MSKMDLAQLHWKHALIENGTAFSKLPPRPEDKLSGWPVGVLSQSIREEILYNVGVCLLAKGRGRDAFACLLDVVRAHPHNPRLWLRLAECVVCARARAAGVGCGRRRELGVEPHVKVVFGRADERFNQTAKFDTSASVPDVDSLPFAYLCVQNAELLLRKACSTVLDASKDNHSAAKESSEDEQESSEGSDPPTLCEVDLPMFIYAPPSNGISRKEVPLLRCSILTAKSFIALNLGDTERALNAAQAVLDDPDATGPHKYLAHLYSGVALVTLDRLSDALRHFSPDAPLDVARSRAFAASPTNGGGEGEGDLSKTSSIASRIASATSQLTSGVQVSSTSMGAVAVQASPPVRELPRDAWDGMTTERARGILHCNMAVTHALHGFDVEKARTHARKAVELFGFVPSYLSALQIYIELHQGHEDNARKIADGRPVA